MVANAVVMVDICILQSHYGDPLLETIQTNKINVWDISKFCIVDIENVCCQSLRSESLTVVNDYKPKFNFLSVYYG